MKKLFVVLSAPLLAKLADDHLLVEVEATALVVNP